MKIQKKNELVKSIVKARSLAVRTNVRAGVAAPKKGGGSGSCGAGTCG